MFAETFQEFLYLLCCKKYVNIWDVLGKRENTFNGG